MMVLGSESTFPSNRCPGFEPSNTRRTLWDWTQMVTDLLNVPHYSITLRSQVPNMPTVSYSSNLLSQSTQATHPIILCPFQAREYILFDYLGNYVGLNMGTSQKKWPEYRAQHTLILIMETSTEGPLISGTPKLFLEFSPSGVMWEPDEEPLVLNPQNHRIPLKDPVQKSEIS